MSSNDQQKIIEIRGKIMDDVLMTSARAYRASAENPEATVIAYHNERSVTLPPGYTTRYPNIVSNPLPTRILEGMEGPLSRYDPFLSALNELLDENVPPRPNITKLLSTGIADCSPEEVRATLTRSSIIEDPQYKSAHRAFFGRLGVYESNAFDFQALKETCKRLLEPTKPRLDRV